MATPTTLPASFSAGAVLTAAQMNNLRGAFRILQVVQGETATAASSTSVTWVDSTLTATITPSSTSSKILVITSGLYYTDNANMQGSVRILRGSTDIVINTGIAYSSAGAVSNSVTLNKLDAPATTSATTYKVQIQRFAGGGSFNAQLNGSTAIMILMEVSA